MEKPGGQLSGSTKRKVKKDKDIRKAENFKYILKMGGYFTSVNNCPAKQATSNEDSSASDDIFPPVETANISSLDTSLASATIEVISDASPVGTARSHAPWRSCTMGIRYRAEEVIH